MPNKLAVDKATKNAIKNLGAWIRRCRGEAISQSQLAQRVGLSRSNMKYIEDGVNAPTADIYERLIQELSPKPKERERMDRLYMAIRKVPPPDVCKTISQNSTMVDAIRMLDGCELTPEQNKSIHALFAAISKEIREGEHPND